MCKLLGPTGYPKANKQGHPFGACKSQGKFPGTQAQSPRTRQASWYNNRAATGKYREKALGGANRPKCPRGATAPLAQMRTGPAPGDPTTGNTSPYREGKVRTPAKGMAHRPVLTRVRSTALSLQAQGVHISLRIYAPTYATSWEHGIRPAGPNWTERTGMGRVPFTDRWDGQGPLWRTWSNTCGDEVL